MPRSKRTRLSHDGDEDVASTGSSDERTSLDADSDAMNSSVGPDSDGESLPTEDEIAEAQRNTKSRKTQKRKRRATSPSRFGTALQALLKTDTPTSQPLALKPSAAASRQRTDEKLETKARKLLEGEKKEREERNHIQDVIGGWGTERERSLRKVAQRGVVKLFNAIQQTQAAAEAEQEDARAQRGSGKPTLPKPTFDKKKKKKSVTVSGNTEKTLNQDTFLQMIKAGGVVSTS